MTTQILLGKKYTRDIRISALDAIEKALADHDPNWAMTGQACELAYFLQDYGYLDDAYNLANVLRALDRRQKKSKFFISATMTARIPEVRRKLNEQIASINSGIERNLQYPRNRGKANTQATNYRLGTPPIPLIPESTP